MVACINDNIIQLIYAIKKLLYEIAQSVPWVKCILAEDKKHCKWVTHHMVLLITSCS